MKAVGERVLAQRMTFNGGVDQLESGLFVVKNEKEHWDEAMMLRVVAVGSAVDHDVKAGDVVVTRGMAGSDVKIGGVPYISLHSDDLLAVVDTV